MRAIEVCSFPARSPCWTGSQQRLVREPGRWPGAELDSLTLMMAIQAVRDQIRRYESLLTSATLRDPGEIQSLIFSYEKAAERLKQAYEDQWSEGSDLPPYSKLVP